MKLLALAVWLGFALPAMAEGDHADAPINCTNCGKWNVAQEPFKLFGNTYYVGTRELASVLITGPRGHILIDGALPQSAALIEANIVKLGFRLKDVKLLLNSHEHFDHAGGLAALQRDTGAIAAASALGAKVLREGVIDPSDAQYEAGNPQKAPKVARVRAVADGEVLKLGTLRVTAHATPAHAPGGTTWTWQSCEGKRCLDVVYADSLSAVSADGFKFAARAPVFNAAFDKVAALKCDIVVAAHPVVSGTLEALAAQKPGVNPFIDPEGCRTLVAGARANFAERLIKDQAQ